MTVDTARNKAVYFARLAEQTERYDEMAEHMKEANRLSPGELTEEERRLLSVAYNNTMRVKKAAWRSISDAARDAAKKGDGQGAELARQYCAKVEDELERICTRTRDAFASQQKMTDEAAVFYQKMKADTYRHAAALQTQSPQKKEAEAEAQKAYEEASKMAQSALPAAHPLQFGLALSHSVFQAEVLGDVNAACRTAPLRHLSSCGGLSPRGCSPVGVVAQRLCDLLLEFPDAAIDGVRWSSLASSYAEVYGETLNLAHLGHETPLAAAHALFAEVLRHQRCDATGRAEDQDDPLVAVDDMVALTPLPGFAGSWPALYKILCDLVRSCGSEEEALCDGDPQGRILLLSQLRPLLDSASEDEQTPASQARSLLLSQLRPVSKLGKECTNNNGLSFRDNDGCSRKLQKLGHVVKAVLQWRDRRVRWRRGREAKPTPLDHAVGPTLELVFCKRLNNLVLCLNDQVDSTTGNQEGFDTINSNLDKGLGHRPFDDNPFKWQPIVPSSDAKWAALKRSSSTPGIYLSPCMPSCSAQQQAPQTFTTEQCENNAIDVEAPPPMPAENIARGPRRHSQSPSTIHRLFPRRSPSRGARSPSCPSRSRSLGKGNDNATGSGVSLRCTSEPPRQCWADMCDDSDDCVQFHWFQNSTTFSDCGKTDNVFLAGIATESVRDSNYCSNACTGQEVVNSAQRWISPRPVARTTAHVDHRSPSVGARAGTSRVGRARSLTQRDDSHVRLSSDMSHEYTRCTSEPPQNRWLDVFDDPFEPPPQEVNWEYTRVSAEFFECGPDTAPHPPSLPQRELPPLTQCRSIPQVAIVSEHHHYRVPWEPQVPPPMAKRSGSRSTRTVERVGRARSLTRSPAGAMLREAQVGLNDENGQRCTSEPPNCWIGSFDDPFEPPPQSTWCSPNAPMVVGSDFGSVRSVAENVSVGAIAAEEPAHYGDVHLAPRLFFSCVQPDVVSSQRNRFQSRSLTRTSSGEPTRLPMSSRQDADNGHVRCTSEPPHQRVVNIFDDPFEPPPQDFPWSWPVSPVHVTSLPLRFGHEGVWC